jgi:hypothetical protein
MAPLPLYPHQAVILDPRHLLPRYAPLYAPNASTPSYNYNEIVDGFLEGLILGYILWALLYLAYITVKFCVWITRCTLDAIDAAVLSFIATCPECYHPLCTGVCERSTKPYPNGWSPNPFDEKDTKTWPLPSPHHTDLWCVLSDEEMDTLRKEKGVKNTLDRRQRSKTVGHVQYLLPVDKKERRRQIKALRESVYFVHFVGDPEAHKL